MNKRILTTLLLLSYLLSNIAFAQVNGRKEVFNKKRKQVSLTNYFISMNTFTGLTIYSGLMEWKIDSLRKLEKNEVIRNNLTLLKYRATNALSETTFNNDSFAGAIDTWALCYQLKDYFSTEKCEALYGSGCGVVSKLFTNYANRIGTELDGYIDKQRVLVFAQENPIMDDDLNRSSVIPLLSKWIGKDELGLKSGLLTMTDITREMNNRLEYFADMVPKQAKWQMEYELGSFLSEDSINEMMNDTHHMIQATTKILENSESIINFNRDTVLENLNYQRIVSLQVMRNERIAVLEAITKEREIVLQALHDERIGIENFAEQQRIAMTEDMKGMSGTIVKGSTQIGKELIDYVFIKLLILTIIIGISLVVGLILYKKL